MQGRCSSRTRVGKHPKGGVRGLTGFPWRTCCHVCETESRNQSINSINNMNIEKLKGFTCINSPLSQNVQHHSNNMVPQSSLCCAIMAQCVHSAQRARIRKDLSWSWKRVRRRLDRRTLQNTQQLLQMSDRPDTGTEVDDR